MGRVEKREEISSAMQFEFAPLQCYAEHTHINLKEAVQGFGLWEEEKEEGGGGALAQL